MKYLESLKDNSNYLEFLFKKQSYVDASSALNDNGYKLYHIPNNPLIKRYIDNTKINANKYLILEN